MTRASNLEQRRGRTARDFQSATSSCGWWCARYPAVRGAGISSSRCSRDETCRPHRSLCDGSRSISDMCVRSSRRMDDALRIDWMGELWIRDIDSEMPREIPAGAAVGVFNTDTAYYLTWSPDSRDLAFPADRRVPTSAGRQEGGSATTICKLPPGRTDWSADCRHGLEPRRARRSCSAGMDRVSYEVAARGGAPVLLTKEVHADDVLLFETPEGRAIVFAESTRRPRSRSCGPPTLAVG